MIKSEFISELSKAKQKKSFQLWNNKSYYILFLQLTTIILALISTSLLSHAKEVTLAWDSSNQASGYILYYGLKSRSYENTHVTVYVAFDNRSPIPFWLSDFTDTGYDLRTHVSFSIYAKDFPAGSVYLGPNRHSGSMYTVIVVNN